MGANSSNIGKQRVIDAVHAMNMTQRVDHLVVGYIRLNCTRENSKYFANDLLAICISYIGNGANLCDFKSRTELMQDRYTDGKKFAKLETGQELRVLILGASGVGKSTLCRRFTTGEFEDNNICNYGEDTWRKQVEVDGHIFMFDVYDCWGPEYNAMQDQWMRECDLFIFVYSITSSQTFEEIEILIEKVRRVQEEMYWFGIMAGNKCDLEDQRQVSEEEWREITWGIEKYDHETFDLRFYETSAKEQINNIEIFHECAEWYTYGHNLYQEKIKEMMSNEPDDKCQCSIL